MQVLKSGCSLVAMPISRCLLLHKGTPADEIWCKAVCSLGQDASLTPPFPIIRAACADGISASLALLEAYLQNDLQIDLPNSLSPRATEQAPKVPKWVDALLLVLDQAVKVQPTAERAATPLQVELSIRCFLDFI